MLRIVLSFAYPILLVPLYLDWSRRQAEAQIDKMQRAVFNSPGAEAPVPPAVVVGGMGLTAGYALWTRLMRIHHLWNWLGLLVGVPLGVVIYFLRQTERRD